MRVLIAGAGAVGQWLGGLLHEARHDVTLLTTPRHVEAFRQGGLRIRGLAGIAWDPKAVTSPAQAKGPFEAVVLTAKAHQTAPLAQATAGLLDSKGVFLSLQNGLGNGGKIRRFIPADRIAIGLTSHGLTLEAPGRVLHVGAGATLVGPLEGANYAAARGAQALLADAGLKPEWHDAMRGFVWRKAIVNHALNPVAALHGAANGQVRDREDLYGLGLDLLQEATALARRARVHLPPGDMGEAFTATLERTRDNKCSMLQDVEARRATEIEQITGRMVRLGKALQAPMPRSDSVYGRVKDLESSYLETGVAARMAQEEMAWETEPF